MFDYGVLQPYVDDISITDIDTNGKSVFITSQEKGRYKVLDLEDGYLEDMLNRMSNYPQIDKEFNFHSPILDGTMDNLRIHAVHKSIMNPQCWLSIRKNPIDLVVTEQTYPKLFELLKVANKLNWSYVFGGERGSGKTQIMRTCISMLEDNKSVSIIAENDEMHMLEVLPERLISQYVVNDVMNYTLCASSVLRDNSDYVVFQEVRDSAIDDLLLILSSSSRVLTTLHVKNALLMPQRMVQLSNQKNDEHLLSTIHDYVQMCVVPRAIENNGKIERYIAEIALFWNDENNVPCKQLIYENKENKNPMFYDIPKYYQDEFDKMGIVLNWK